MALAFSVVLPKSFFLGKNGEMKGTELFAVASHSVHFACKNAVFQVR